jgi:hypothetical protein
MFEQNMSHPKPKFLTRVFTQLAGFATGTGAGALAMVLLLASVKLRSQSKSLLLSALGHFTPVVVTSLAKTPHGLFFLFLLLLLLLLSLLIDE